MSTGSAPPALDREACYRALRARDARFDGRFYTAVLSTGIFCRPICPARPPRLEHCVFFPSAAAASAAGFRPCLRCRPELAPGTAGWRGTARTVSRALALIADGAWGEGREEEALAERLGIGGRQLRRLFARHVGASPVAVAQAQRVLFAKRLVAETALPMAEVALASGFGSLRRFNETMRRTFGRPPGALRRAERSEPPGGAMALRLVHTAPYPWQSLLAFLGARAVPGVEEVGAGQYRRSVAIDGGLGSIAVRASPGGDHLVANLHVPRTAALPEVVGRLRRLFDLDADVQAIGEHLARDPVLAPLVAARPGVRVPGAWDPFELAVRAILGQQVSVAAARTLAGRLAAAYGRRAPGGGVAFPGPEQLADASLARLGLTSARARAVRALARAAAADPSLLEGRGDLEETVGRLVELPGFGRWTAHYVAMRAMREPDAFPDSDLGLLRAAARRGLRPSPEALARRAEAWRPWRAYAAMYLWMADAPARRRKGT